MTPTERSTFLARLESDEPFTPQEIAEAAAALARGRAARQVVLELPPPLTCDAESA